MVMEKNSCVKKKIGDIDYIWVKRFTVQGSRLSNINLPTYKELEGIQQRISFHPLGDCCNCLETGVNELWHSAFTTLNCEPRSDQFSL